MAISSLSTTSRLTGLYSGLDTDSLVKSMMQIEQLKLDRQTRSLTTQKWKQEAYSGVTSDLKSFMNDFISVLGGNSMMKSSNYVTFKASVTGANASAVSVTGSSSAYAGTVQIDQIVQLATASKAVSTGGVSKSGELSSSNSAKLSELDFANSLGFVNGKISFSINGEEFTFSQDDTLQNMINTINASDAGVNMVYSRLTDKISFTSKETGTDGSVEIKNITGNAFGTNSAFGIDSGTYKTGQNAIVKIDGITVEKSSNSFTIDGINYTLNSVTAEGDEPIKITLEQDVSTAVDYIKKFVEGYNTLINKLNDLVTSRKSTSERSYTALTDEEKESMTEAQIEQWETIAKKGLLYNDAGIQGLISGLRGALYDTVKGAGLSPADIGLRTGTWDTRGEISLDEDALRAALEKNPHQVMNVFMDISSSSDTSTAYKENGLLYRMNNLMNSYIKGSGQTALDSLESSIYKTTNAISDMEDRMLELEEKYYLKYAALEEAMSQLESQSNWLTTMLSSSSS